MLGVTHRPVQPNQSSFEFPSDPWADGFAAGVDEVGIGPLAGPVAAAAVILDGRREIEGLADSKTLTAATRRRLLQLIESQAVACSVGWASVEEIDALNILRASHLAMQRAVGNLSASPSVVLVDGNKTPHLPIPAVAVVQGDRRVLQISAASILAKVARDAVMVTLDEEFPGYGFARHKGYPTRQHVLALRELGPCAAHRRSFAPVRDALGQAPTQAALLAGVGGA